MYNIFKMRERKTMVLVKFEVGVYDYKIKVQPNKQSSNIFQGKILNFCSAEIT